MSHSGTCGKAADSYLRSSFPSRYADSMIKQSEFDHPPPMAHPYTDPNFAQLLVAYGSKTTVIYPQIRGIGPGRVPLPLDLSENMPIYVNAKQYHGILRRRQIRAKLEARNILVTRKPYLHESRHRHALKRARGSGGRFLSKKDLQESNSLLSDNGSSISHSKLGANVSNSDIHHSETDTTESCTQSCMDVTSIFNGNGMVQLQQQQQDFRFPSYPLRIGTTTLLGGKELTCGT